MDFTDLLLFFQTHGYWILFLVIMFEGPIAITAAAFAASFGIFNVYFILVLSFFACTAGDMFWYFLGKFWRESIIDRHFGKIMKSKNMKKVKKLLEGHYFRAIILIKLVPPLPVPGLIFAGADELKFRKFLFASALVNVVSCVVFVVLGYYLGAFVDKMFFGNMQLIIAGVLISGTLLFVYRKNSHKIYKKIHRIN